MGSLLEMAAEGRAVATAKTVEQVDLLPVMAEEQQALRVFTASPLVAAEVLVATEVTQTVLLAVPVAQVWSDT